MKICFPVQENKGMESRVYNHFGSAPMFVMVDVATGNISVVTNKDQRHAHGSCNPIMALGSHEVDAVVVGGIGSGALSKLNQKGIRVFQAAAASVRENISMLLSSQLAEFTLSQCCGGHSAGGACAH